MNGFHALVPDHRDLPSVPGLLAFAAALRHGSVTLAAEELGLTQSAVSHRLRALEAFFGTRLLDRLNPGLRPTPAGARLAEALGPALAGLSALRATALARGAPAPFRLGTGQGLFAWWLSPLLPALAAAFPRLAIDVETWDSAGQAARAEVELGLFWQPPGSPPSGTHQLAFPPETVFPVAAPALLRAHRATWRETAPLLAKGRSGEETGPEWSWPAWIGPGRARPFALRFRDIGGVLQAALDGSGVALGRSLLVAGALRRRRLVRLAPRSEARPCGKLQVARWRDHPDAAAVAAWLVAQAVRDGGGA
ncbi:LysR family transcriptional regulator [Falsiroseomonas sp. HW251]|uniref:LysR family transcriptional regulator n=1 Tax=Falsiroseomonas sp. HW251 TaxID=3390998 RepID=UPI003D31E9C2